ERQVDIGVNGTLANAVDVVLHRVFGGDELVGNLVEFIESRVQGRGLSSPGRPGDQDDAVGLVDDVAELLDQVLFHADLIEIERHRRAVEHADDHALAKHGGQDANAQIDRVAADVEFDAAVLGESAFGDVEVRHDFDAAGDRGGQVARR